MAKTNIKPFENAGPATHDDVISFTVKLPRSLKNAFIETAKNQEDNASKLVRRWIKKYLQQHSPDQGNLF